MVADTVHKAKCAGGWEEGEITLSSYEILHKITYLFTLHALAKFVSFHKKP